MIKGFALNDDLLKNAGQGNYFDELLARIRDLRNLSLMFGRHGTSPCCQTHEILFGIEGT